jgi:hypothetical protein
MLHDRRIPVSRPNIDHVTIGAGGVTVIDAKHDKGKVRGGLLRPRSEDLLIGGRDQTRLVEGLRRRIDLVTAELARAGESVDVRGAVCMVSGDALPLFANLEVDDAAIGSPKRIAKIARRPGSLAPHHVQRVAAAVARAFPPA